MQAAFNPATDTIRDVLDFVRDVLDFVEAYFIKRNMGIVISPTGVSSVRVRRSRTQITERKMPAAKAEVEPVNSLTQAKRDASAMPESDTPTKPVKPEKKKAAKKSAAKSSSTRKKRAPHIDRETYLAIKRGDMEVMQRYAPATVNTILNTASWNQFLAYKKDQAAKARDRKAEQKRSGI